MASLYGRAPAAASAVRPPAKSAIQNAIKGDKPLFHKACGVVLFSAPR